MAAAAGGVTTVVDMPLNSSPPTVDCVQLQRKQAAVRDQAVVDYALWGGLINNNLAHLESLCAERVVGFKMFLVSSPDFSQWMTTSCLPVCARCAPSTACWPYMPKTNS